MLSLNIDKKLTPLEKVDLGWVVIELFPMKDAVSIIVEKPCNVDGVIISSLPKANGSAKYVERHFFIDKKSVRRDVKAPKARNYQVVPTSCGKYACFLGLIGECAPIALIAYPKKTNK